MAPMATAPRDELCRIGRPRSDLNLPCDLPAIAAPSKPFADPSSTDKDGPTDAGKPLGSVPGESICVRPSGRVRLNLPRGSHRPWRA